jgi:hypothetical protein
MGDDSVGLSTIPPADRKRLEEMDEAYVRQVGNEGGLPRQQSLMRPPLGKRAEAQQAKQTRLAETTLKTAWIAAGLAAAAGIIVTRGT